MTALIEHQWLAAGIGLLFLALGWWARRRSAAAVGLAWVLYAAYERGMQSGRLCTGDCNIRIDLVFIFPLLVVGSVVAAVGVIRVLRRGGRS